LERHRHRRGIAQRGVSRPSGTPGTDSQPSTGSRGVSPVHPTCMRTGTRTVRVWRRSISRSRRYPDFRREAPEERGFLLLGLPHAEKGYDTKFIYAGYGYFDDMNQFLRPQRVRHRRPDGLRGGRDLVRERVGGLRRGLFSKTIREAETSHAAGRPFFQHGDDHVEPPSVHLPGRKDRHPLHTGREGGVKYADYAIGRFLERASKEAWFHDTLFVIVADHCAGSAGRRRSP